MRNRLYLNRWLSFVASCLLQTTAGLSYSFSIFAPALKEIWGYHETQIATVGSCFNIGGYLAILSGALFDRLERHKRFGPRFVALVGSLLLAAGYLGLYAAATGVVAPSFAFVCLCAVLGGNSSTWFDTACIVTNVRNFPRDRGTVVGILKAFVGLSASIYSSIYAAAFAPAAVRFLLFIGCGPPLVTAVLIALINLVPEAYQEPQPPQNPPPPPPAAAAEEGASETAPLLLPPSAAAAAAAAAAGAGAGAPAPARFSTQARFTFTYTLVAGVAMYQTAAALWEGAVHPGPTARRALLGGLLALLGVLLAVPLRSGDWVHRKPRPEAVERVRRSLLRRLAAKGAGAFSRRSRSSSRSTAAAAAPPPPPVGAGVGAGGLEEPLLLTEGKESVGVGAAVRPVEPTPAALALAGVKAMDEASGAGVTVGPQPAAAPVFAPAPPPGPTLARGSERGEESGAGESGAEGVVAEREGELEAQLEALEEVPALPDLSLGAAARTPLFWLLMLQFSVGLGTGLSLLNNLGSIVVALGGRQGGQVVFVSLFSVANATGRLTGGVLSEHLLRRYGTPRTLLLLGVSCLTLVTVVGAAMAQLRDLYVLSLVAGLAFGAHWGLIPAITSDLFGLTHFGSNYTGLQLGPAAGGYLLATVLTGKLYDRAARRHGDALFCLGSDCYFETWCVLGGLNLIATLGTRELYSQTAKRYRRIVRAGGV